MQYLLPELTRRASGVLAVATLAVMVAPAAHAALQGRDLDATKTGFEAYYDTALNITWLADANYAKTSGYDTDGLMTWNAAKTWVAQLNINGVTGWRLPDVKPVNGSTFQYGHSNNGSTDIGYNIVSTQSELANLYHVTLGNKSYRSTSGSFQPGHGFQNTGPFSNVQAGLYWSGVEFAPSTSKAWFFHGLYGSQYENLKSNELLAWAVRSGDVAAVAVVPEPQTYALALAGLAVAGALARKRRA